MYGPSGNYFKRLRFLSSPNVSLEFVPGNIWTLGKTKLAVSFETIH